MMILTGMCRILTTECWHIKVIKAQWLWLVLFGNGNRGNHS